MEIGLLDIAIVIILFLLLCGLKVYYKAKKLHDYYSEVLKKSGYQYKINPFGFFSLSFMKRKRQAVKKYGDSFYHRKNDSRNFEIQLHNIFQRVFIVIAHPDLLKAFYSPQMVYLYQKENQPIQAIIEVFGQGIVFSQGSIWKNKRKFFSKIFNYDLLKANIPNIAALCDSNIQLYEKRHEISPGKYSFYILEWTSKILIGFMLQNFFGCGEINQMIGNKPIQHFIMGLTSDAAALSYHPLMAFFGKRAYRMGLTSKMRQIKRNIEQLRNTARKLISQRNKKILQGSRSETKTDLVQSLHYQNEKNKKEGNTEEFEYTAQDLIDEFCTFLVAGTDTSSHLLMMMVYYICDNPRIEERLRKQIDLVIKSDNDYTFENLKKIQYIDWIQLETTRYYGPGTSQFMRKALKDHSLLNIPIVKDMGVSIQLTGIHYSEKYYKDPKQFRPQRWESECNNLHPFALLGFGGGPRTCIGKHLALLQSKIILIKLFKRYSKITVQKQRIMNMTFLYGPNRFDTIFQR